MRRGLFAWLLIVVILAALGAVAYFSHNPDSAWLTRMRTWPVVGRLASEFQDSYRSPGPPAPLPSSQVSIVVVPPPAAALDVHPYAHLKPGSALRTRPSPSAPLIARLDRYYVLPYLKREGDWVEVRPGGRRGWVRVGPRDSGAPPPLGEEPMPPHPLAGIAAPPALLRAAEAQMVNPPRRSRLGPYPLVTDFEQPGLLAALDRLVGQIEPLYRERYGLNPVGTPKATIVIFALKKEFEAFNRSDPRLRGLRPEGTEVPGLVALYAEGHNRSELEATLVHEITHLLNRRGLGPALPPWINEGMAEDMASSRITPMGTIDGNALAGVVTVSGKRRTLMGAQAGVLLLAKQMHSAEAPSLIRLTTMDWRSFVAAPSAAEHYRQAGLLFRCLATGPVMPGHAVHPREGLQRFLREIASGGPATGDALVEALGTSWSQLHTYFRSWLESQIPKPFTLEDEISTGVQGAATSGGNAGPGD